MSAAQTYGLMVVGQITGITVLAGIAIVCLRRQAALRHAIGVVALVFLLICPITTLLLPKNPWLVPTSLHAVPIDHISDVATQPAPHAFEPKIPAAENDELNSVIGGTQQLSMDSVGTQASALSAVTAHSNQAETIGDRSRFLHGDGKTWFSRALNIAAVVWLFGIVVLLCQFFRRQREIRRLLASIEPGQISADAAIAAQSALGVMKLPSIGVSDIAPIPLVVGYRRPRIILPESFVLTASVSQLRDVLVHEAAHVLRGDSWIHAGQQIAGIVFWPHPGVHWLNRQLSQAREEVCDNYVLRRANSADYCQMLLEFAERCGSSNLALSLLGLFSRRWSLEQRIAGILHPRRSKTTSANSLVAAVAATFIVAMSFLIGGVRMRAQTAREQVAAPVKIVDKPIVEIKKVTVHGLCQDQHSKPVPGARVRVFRKITSTDPYELVVEGRTGEDGNYSIPEVEARKDPLDPRGMTDLIVVATASDHVSAMSMLDDKAEGEASLILDDSPGTLSGIVMDEQGKPLAGVTVFIASRGDHPIPQFRSSMTDENGHYSISDLKSWDSKGSGTTDPKTGLTSVCTECYFSLRHPKYAVTRAACTAIPQEVNVTIHPPAIIEGIVIDEVTGEPLQNVKVAAQGITEHGWHTTKTDERGHYRLLTNRDYFNIWAETDERIAIAVKAILAEAGKTLTDANIRMVRGAFVVGSVIDGATGKPIAPAPDQPEYVAHYGPARPRTGAAVTSTPVNIDGSYRLQVAPGRNYVYTMNGTVSVYVDVEDGQELKLDLRTGSHVSEKQESNDPDRKLRDRLYRQAKQEKAKQERIAKREKPDLQGRNRPETPTGKLLDELAEQNAGDERFHDSWLRTLKSIVDLGPDAVPELISELDATENGMMLRSLGFVLRAINDQRAVPALIRAIPKTLRPSESDMGCRADDDELLKFAQKYDLDRSHRDRGYSFGRPVREVFAALRSLTGTKFNEEELYFIFLKGTADQTRMKRLLFTRTTQKWAEWWEQNSKDRVEDSAYWKVNLPETPADDLRVAQPGVHFKTTGGGSNWILQSVLNPRARKVFYDFDTGRTAALPKKWRDEGEPEKRMDEIIAWAAEEGFDLMGTEYTAADGNKYYAIRSIGLKAWELPPIYWKKEFRDIAIEELQGAGAVAKEMLLHVDPETESYDPKTTATFVCVTSEGTPGLIYIGIEVLDDSLKPGGISTGDNELDPVAFYKGRRFGFWEFEEIRQPNE